MTDYTASERVARMNAKRRAEGWGQFKVWTPPGTDIEALRRAYPGKKGGIDWGKVLSAALAHADHHPEAGQ